MKKATTILLILCVFISCTHTKEKHILMDKDGNYYILTPLIHVQDGYSVIPLDTTMFTIVNFKCK